MCLSDNKNDTWPVRIHNGMLSPKCNDWCLRSKFTFQRRVKKKLCKVSRNVSIRMLKFFDVLKEFRAKLTPFYETNPGKFHFYKISRCLPRSKSVAYAWPYHESHRWLTHHHIRWVPPKRVTTGLTHRHSGGGPLPWGSPMAPTMRATSGLTYLHSGGGPLTWEPPVAHAPSFGSWTPTTRATSGLLHRNSGGRPLPW